MLKERDGRVLEALVGAGSTYGGARAPCDRDGEIRGL